MMIAEPTFVALLFYGFQDVTYHISRIISCSGIIFYQNALQYINIISRIFL